MKWKNGKKASEAEAEPEETTSPSTKQKDEKMETPPIGNYWRILAFGTRVEHLFLIVALGCAVASGVPLPLMNIIFGGLAGDFNSYFLPGSNVSEGRFKSSVNTNTLYIVYLFIGKFVLTYGGMFFFRVVGLRISAALRVNYLKSLFRQPVKKLDQISAGTVANTITTAANTIQLSISDRLHTMFQSLAVVIAAFAVAFSYSWALTLVTSSGILFILIVYSACTPFTLRAVQRVEKADEKHATVAAEAVSSIRTVHALGAESKLIQRHTRWVDESHKYAMKLAPQLALQLSPLFFAIYSCFALAFWFGLKLYQDGNIGSVSTVIIVFFSVLLVTGVLGQIVQPMMYIQKAIAASTNFFEIMDAEGVRLDGLSAPDVSAHGDIHLEHVNFSYPTRPDVQILKDFNATFQAGKTTALVGPSGSGKSTIVGLLERWYELSDKPMPPSKLIDSSKTKEIESQAAADDQETKPVFENSGSITTDSHDITDFNLKWWRSQIGLVQQEPFLFNDTIERNVAYGLTGTEWEHADDAKKSELVREACKEAFADEFISKLSEGYSTLVGEGGIKLSGGQRQRVAIARSIVRKPAILILDEATSAIDVKGERIVQEALDRVSKNRTTIMIAHRLSTIRKADHIIVLRNGAKVEEGTHEYLVSLPDGLYQGLVQAQALEKDYGALEDSTIPAEAVLTRTLSEARPMSTSRSIHSLKSDESAAEEGTFGTYRNRGFFHTVGVLLYEQRSHWPWYIVVLVAAMGAGSANALQSWFFAQLVQAFLYTGQRLRDAQNFWALMFFILALAVGFFYAILGMGSGVIQAHVATTTKKDYFQNTLKMPVPYFDRKENASGSVMSVLSGDPKQLGELMGLNGSFPLISIFNVVGCIIISFYFGWKLTLVVLFGVMPVVLFGTFVRVRYEVQFEEMNGKVFSESSQFATEAIGAFRTVASLAMEDDIIDKYQKLLQDQIQKSTRKASYAVLFYAFTDSVELLGMALAFWYGGQLLASREYNPIQFFVIYAAIVQGAQAAGQYLSITPNVAKATASSNRILRMRAEAARKSKSTTHAVMPTKSGFGSKIEFKDVNFHYASQSIPLFSRLNISIEAGQFVAFVGPSGCGKTSTISLLERFYRPVSGTIALDDTDINDIDLASYRRGLALVSQEPRLFSGTIRQNLVLGVEESSVTEDEIFQACRDAEIHEFITSLPEGYDTELGLNTQTALSGGQKQRVCLARALLRKPKLLLLDEATSSLDSQSERLVQGAIERLAGQRSMTVIAVAHRLATIQKADVIFVFGERDHDARKGSKIVEKGTHQSLLARKGIYWSMCQAQALDA